MDKESSTQKICSRSPGLYRLTSADLDMWDYVPPVPVDGHSTAPTPNDQHNMVYNAGAGFGSADPFNDRLESQQKHCTIPRPTHLWKPWSANRRLSASTDQLSPSRAHNHHLIDLNSTFSIDQNGNSNNNNNESTKERIMELFKTVRDKVTTGGGGGTNLRSNSLSTNALMSNSGFNFHANPIYHNYSNGGFNNSSYDTASFRDKSSMPNNNNNVNQYASLYWPSAASGQQKTAPTACPTSSASRHPMMTTSSSLPAASPLSPMAPNPFITNHYMNQPERNTPLYQNCLQSADQQMLIEKIRSISMSNNNHTENERPGNCLSHNPAKDNVLRPTPVGPRTPEDPQQIINLFDPLVPCLPLASATAAATASGINQPGQTSPTKEEPRYVDVTSQEKATKLMDSSTQKQIDDVSNNNNNSNDDKSKADKPQNIISERDSGSIFECFKVEPRDTFNKEVNEYCEHLKSLYVACFTSKSTRNNDNNSGLVFSPRIDIDYRSRSSQASTSDKLYLYGASNLKKSNSVSQSNEPDEENLITIDVRFHALVYAHITGHVPDKSNVVDFVKLLDSNYQWFSMIYRVNLAETVDVLISNVIYAFPPTGREVHTGDFLLKLYSINEYLQADTALSSYVYVQNCKKNNKDIVLELVDHTAPEFWRPFLRCDLDTKRILNDFRYEEVLPKIFVHNFHGYTAEQLNTLIDDLIFSYTTLISAFSDILYVRENKQLFESVLEKIYNLIRFLSGVQTSSLVEGIDILKKSYIHVENYAGDDQKSSYCIEKIIALFEDAFLFVIKELIKIIKMYGDTFPVSFRLPNRAHGRIQKAMSFDDDENKFVTMKRRRKVEISQIADLFTLDIDICSQLNIKWLHKYSDFAIVVNLFHGFNLIKTKVSERSKSDSVLVKKYRLKRLMFNQKLDFDIPTYMLPRETRIEFILVGFRNYNKGEADTLATTFFYLYDLDEILLNGPRLLPWTEMESQVSLNILMNSSNNSNESELSETMRELLENNYLVSHNLDPNAAMLVMHVAGNLSTNFDYCFPKIKDSQEITLKFVIPFEDSVANSSADSLYGFHGYNTNRLDRTVIEILQKNPIERLTSIERDIIWNQRKTIQEFPGSILKIMKSPPSWSCHDLPSVYSLLKKLDSGPLSCVFRTKIEALQMMSADYPDKMVRRTVVKWLNSISVDELCDYLPQLVQSLRFETSIDSYLIWSLFEFSLISARFCHYFYWQLKSCLNDRTFGPRCQIYMNSLIILCGERTREQFRQQNDICEQFSIISGEIKQAAKDARNVTLRNQLQKVDEKMRTNPISLPLSPSLFVNALEINQCSYFNSNSLPLKLVFYGAPPYRFKNHEQSVLSAATNTKLQSIYESKRCRHKIIFKCGDDLRKDMLVMQVISIINRVWLRSGLDLRLVTFGVLNTSDRTGMIEMVSRASTLREIQLEHGLAGNFKHHTISTWLKRNNNNEFDYKMAIENFVHSCAGYLVITYLLGICDRHNDNIMVTSNGKLFHIDFGKFFGDAQMMAGIKRDRVPFVFTADMAFAINEGGVPSKNYQFFVDLCCRCFLLVRQHGDFLLALLAMMIRSGIDYLSADTIQYFHKALMPNLTESQARAEFTRLIEKTVCSLSTPLNFFIHSIAQSLSGSGNSGSVQDDPSPGTSSNYAIFSDKNNDQHQDLDKTNDSVDSTANNANNLAKTDADAEDESDLCHFSFTRCRATEAQDGRIAHLEIVNFRFFMPEKNEKIYFYKVKVDRKNSPENFVYRSFKEFLELHDKLSKTFPLVKFYSLKRSPMLNRGSRHEISAQRTKELQIFLKNLLGLASEIAHSDIVYTFFGPILRDQQYMEIETISTHSSLSIMSPIDIVSSPMMLRRQPKIKLDISYRDGTGLNVLVIHARNLDNGRITAPDTYVKIYLQPDPSKSTKRKTRVQSKSAHPIFMENLQYNEPFQSLAYKTLEVSLWESDMTGNKRLGQVEIPLSKIDIKGESNEQWYDLH